MAKPDVEVIAIQERLKKHLPRVLGKSPDRPVNALVRRGEERDTVLVRFWYDDRGTHPHDYEAGRQLALSERLHRLTTLPDLAFVDWLTKCVTRLLHPSLDGQARSERTERR